MDFDMTDIQTLRRQIEANPQRMFPPEDEPNLRRLSAEMGFTIELSEQVIYKRGSGKRQLQINFPPKL
jgi:hypothetical protein